MASVNVTVLSVDGWDRYVDELQPDFQMTAEKALTEVVPQTREFEQSLERAMALEIAATFGLEARDKDDEDEKEEDEGEEEQLRSADSSNEGEGEGEGSENDDSKNEEDGDAVDDDGEDSDSDTDSTAAPSIDFVAAPKIDGDAPSVEPFTRYSAATALFQEVKLISSYLRSAANQGQYDPFIVRMQIAVMPYARNQPYDTYVNISFRAQEPPETTCSSFEHIGSFVLRMLIGDGLCSRPKQLPQGIQVVPVLVTENLERSLESRSFSRVLEFAAAVNVLASFGGVDAKIGAGWRQKLKRLQAALGNDLNSLLMVTSAGPDTLRVRLGAMNQGSTRQAMVPRTHSVTFLLLVPSGGGNGRSKTYDGPIDFVARAEFVDIRTGRALPASRAGQRERIREALDILVKRYGIDELRRGPGATMTVFGQGFQTKRVHPRKMASCYGALIEHAQFRNFDGFNELLAREPDGVDSKDCGDIKDLDLERHEILALWNGLLSMPNLANEVSFGRFDLDAGDDLMSGCPPSANDNPNDFVFDCEAPSLTVYDDGSKATVQIAGVDYAVEKRMSAELVASDTGAPIQSLVATKISYTDRTSVASIEFPSPSALLGDGDPDRRKRLESGTYELRLRQSYPMWIGFPGYADTFVYKHVKVVVVNKKEKDEKPKLKPVPWTLETAKVLYVHANTAKVNVTVKNPDSGPPKGAMELTAGDGCQIDKVTTDTGSPLKAVDGILRIKVPGIYSIELGNVGDHSRCTLVLTGVEGANGTRSELFFDTKPGTRATSEAK